MTGILYTIIITASTSNLPNSLHDHFSEELGEKGGGEDDDAVVGNCCRKVCNAICVYFEYLIRLSDMKGKGMGGGGWGCAQCKRAWKTIFQHASIIRCKNNSPTICGIHLVNII